MTKGLEGLRDRGKKSVVKARDRGSMPRMTGGRTIWVTDSQWEVVERAIKTARQVSNDGHVSEGLALTYLAAEFLATYGEPD